jgi:hypothetical protein
LFRTDEFGLTTFLLEHDGTIRDVWTPYGANY